MDLGPLAFQGETAASFLWAGCVDPPAAFFFKFVCTADAYILCAGCGDPGLVSFWSLPGTVPGISGASCICAGCVDPLAVFFYMIVYTSGAFILCAGCGDPCLLHFGFSQGVPCGLSVSLWWLFYTDCSDLCPQTLDRNTCPRTVAS